MSSSGFITQACSPLGQDKRTRRRTDWNTSFFTETRHKFTDLVSLVSVSASSHWGQESDYEGQQ